MPKFMPIVGWSAQCKGSGLTSFFQNIFSPKTGRLTNEKSGQKSSSHTTATVAVRTGEMYLAGTIMIKARTSLRCPGSSTHPSQVPNHTEDGSKFTIAKWNLRYRCQNCGRLIDRAVKAR